jgi:hypothetical protein
MHLSLQLLHDRRLGIPPPSSGYNSWPCLLLVAEKGIWNGAGFNDINNFHKASGSHEKTQSHLHTITALKHLV